METADDIQTKWDEARAKNLKGSVSFTTYRGTGHESRADKAVHILQAGDLVVMVGDRGARGPATLKSGEGRKSLTAFKSNAFFSLKNAGYVRDAVRTVTGTFESGFDLWEACFQEHHSRSLEAKRLFIQLCGGEAPSAYAEVAKAAGSVEHGRTMARAKHSYSDNPLYGLI